MSDYDNLVIADGPLAYWKCEEVSGSIATDSSGNGEHATIFTVAPLPTLGIPGPIETDGLSLGAAERFCEHETVSGTPLDTRDDFTLEMWGKVQDVIQNHGLLTRLGQFLVTGSHCVGFFGGVITARITHDAVTSYTLSYSNVELDTWYYIAVVRMGQALVLQVNDQQVDFEFSFPSGPIVNADFNSANWLIGRLRTTKTGGSAFPSDGTSHVAIYGSALSFAQRTAHYLAAKPYLDLRGQCDIRISATLDGSTEPDPIAYPFRHNWSTPVIERFRWRTSRFTPKDGVTELSRQRSGLRRQVEYSHLLYDERLRRRFEARSFGGRKAYVQFEPDKVRLGSVLPAASASLAFDTRYLDFEIGHYALFYESDTKYEYKQLTNVTDSGIEWDDDLTQDYEAYAYVKPVRIAQLPSQQDLTLHTDTVGESSTIYEYLAEDEPLSPRRITEWTPTILSDDGEVFDLAEWQGNDYSENPNIQYVADRSELDFGIGIVSNKQYAWGADVVSPYRMVLDGRPTIAKYLGWLYARAGRHVPFWMPTFRQDLNPLSGVGSGTLNVEGHDYTELYADAENRDALVFIYNDNSYVIRRVNSAAVSGANDALTLNAVVPSFTNLRWLSFLRRVTLSSDDLEIAWQTDDKVVATFAVIDAPGSVVFSSPSPSVSPSRSPSASVSASPSASGSPSASESPSASLSLSPSASISPSASLSLSVSPSSSISPSSSESPSASSSVSPSA